jgi:hypothetical protein
VTPAAPGCCPDDRADGDDAVRVALGMSTTWCLMFQGANTDGFLVGSHIPYAA